MQNNISENIFVPHHENAIKDLMRLTDMANESRSFCDEYIEAMADYLMRYKIVDNKSENMYCDAYVLAGNTRVIENVQDIYNTPTVLVIDLNKVKNESPQTLERFDAWSSQEYHERCERHAGTVSEFIGNLSTQNRDLNKRKNVGYKLIK